MKVTRIREGIYKVVDSRGTWIAKGGFSTINNKWTAYETDNEKNCNTLNNWGVQFDTFKELKNYSQN